MESRKFKMVAVAAAGAVALCLGAVGTWAWLTSTTPEVENVFTVGNVDIGLAETTGESYKMVPGTDIAKDPKVSVEADSEASWVFVKIEESSVLDDYIAYAIADGWIQLPGEEGVFYRAVAASQVDQVFPVLDGDKVSVLEGVTSGMMDALAVEGAVQPTLSFKAYAIQEVGFNTPVEAWAELDA